VAILRSQRHQFGPRRIFYLDTPGLVVIPTEPSGWCKVLGRWKKCKRTD